MEWIIEFFNLDNWMSPGHCVPLDWFRHSVWLAGLYIATLYSIFAYKVLVDLKDSFRSLIVAGFSKALGFVFLLCAATHFIHSTSYMTQYVKPLLVITYPLLCYWHTKLLRVSIKAVRRLRMLKTPEQVDQISLERNKAQDKAVGLEEENAMLKSILAKSYSKKDFAIIKRYLQHA